MQSLLNSLYTLWNQIIYAISNFQIWDIIDILIISFFIYKAIQFLRDSRAAQLIKGLIFLIVAYLLSIWFHLSSVRWVLSQIMDWSLVALAVIFQPELRRALEKIGRSRFSQFGRSYSDKTEKIQRCIDSVCVAVKNMQEQKIGALIVFERTTQLGEIINTGTEINADTSSQMVGNIFFPKSPLHDGALIVRDGRLCAAGCILPLTSNPDLSSQLGTRHRAAIGMSEVSDAVVVVVSEETGMVSLVQNGKIERGYERIRLRETLYELLLDSQNESETASFFKRVLKQATDVKNKIFDKSNKEE